jgi:hypothetical protein
MDTWSFLNKIDQMYRVKPNGELLCFAIVASIHLGILIEWIEDFEVQERVLYGITLKKIVYIFNFQLISG